MFRVLSDEESRKVTRWQAPELDSDVAVANTRQEANPHHSPGDDDVRPLMGSLALKPGHLKTPGAAPQLQTINAMDVFANGSIVDAHRGALFTGQADASMEATRASAEMMQSSYDEGYARGFADGNVALQQHSIKELGRVISAISDASTRSDDAGLEQSVLALSLDIARLVIRREVSIEDTVMLDIVNAGIEQLPGTGRGTKSIRLHPLDANVVRRHFEDKADVQIIDDPLLGRGACRIESGASVVDAGTDDWLHSVSVQLGLLPDAESDTAVVDEQDDDTPASGISGLR